MTWTWQSHAPGGTANETGLLTVGAVVCSAARAARSVRARPLARARARVCRRDSMAGLLRIGGRTSASASSGSDHPDATRASRPGVNAPCDAPASAVSLLRDGDARSDVADVTSAVCAIGGGADDCESSAGSSRPPRRSAAGYGGSGWESNPPYAVGVPLVLKTRGATRPRSPPPPGVRGPDRGVKG